MNRVLVTGARGFIGRYCLNALIERGCAGEVHAITSSTLAQVEGRGVQWHGCDLMKPLAVEHMLRQVRPTHLLHLAWVTTPGEYWTSPLNWDWLDASRRLLDGFVRFGGERVVVAGTCAEYDWFAGRCTEGRTPLRSSTPYAHCKSALGEHLEAVTSKAQISAAWGRVFFTYGPGEPSARLVPSVIHRLLRGEPTVCSAGWHKRDFLHAADLGTAFIRLLESDVEGPVNLGSGEAVTISEIATTIGRLMEVSELVMLGSRPTPKGEPPLIEADTRRLRVEVGFSPRYDLERGLRHSVEWWRARSLGSKAA